MLNECSVRAGVSPDGQRQRGGRQQKARIEYICTRLSVTGNKSLFQVKAKTQGIGMVFLILTVIAGVYLANGESFKQNNQDQEPKEVELQ
ncbi:hypothetical protein GBF38_020619 [Nibea albiflora]|uniref:Uncharacterized protein n=1 Tax=Nibea albiflora TaxID=240163 RepID=A0ACB7FE11_NIBAL|nr:hypothetical protein GBF38_020619 [Nibea albiflora]